MSFVFTRARTAAGDSDRSALIALLVVLALALALVPLAPQRAGADTHIVTVPAGMGPGDSYRLVFATAGTITAGSSWVPTYNNFVTAQANQEADLAALNTTWTAIVGVCTSASYSPTTCLSGIHAHDNTNTNPATWVGVPIYRLDGELVASDNADLWDGTIENPISLTQFGSTSMSPNVSGWGTDRVWVGASADGSYASYRALGTGSCCKFAGRSTTTSGWYNGGGNKSRSIALPLFAISDVITVPPLETEPGAPADVSASLTGFDGITVSWSAPVDDGGTPVLDYTVTLAPGGQSQTVTGSPASFSGLMPTVTYVATVSARNAIGSGPGAETNSVTIPTSQEIAGEVANDVAALVDSGILGGGEAGALVAKLDGAISQIDAGKTGPAVNKLDSFINQVNAFINSGRMTTAQAQTLIDAANTVKDSLG